MPRAARAPQIITWTLSVQRQLARNMSIEASYVGSKSTHLELGGNLTIYPNVLNPAYLSLGNLLNQQIDSSCSSGGRLQDTVCFLRHLASAYCRAAASALPAVCDHQYAVFAGRNLQLQLRFS